MLKSIKLQNYKCFKDETEIDIKPLTVLCGTNSSGKSSILKSLLMLKQSYENNSTLNSITLNGEYTSNGAMGDVIYNQEGYTFELGITSLFNPPPEYNYKKKVKVNRSEVLAYKELSKILNTDKAIRMSTTIEIKSNGTINSVSNVINKYSISVVIEDGTNLEIRLIKSNDLKNRDYNIELDHFITTNGESLSDKTISLGNCACYFDGMKLVNIFAPNNNKYRYEEIFPNIYTIMRYASYVTSSVKHISPLRDEASRFYIYTEDKMSVGSSGKNTAQLIQSSKHNNIIFPNVPCNGKIANKPQAQTLYAALRKWMIYLGLGDLGININNALLQLSANKHNIADVGFGVSQALPIIVEGLLMKERETLLIEQPEIHLHPQSQMAMADFLLAAANGNKNIIVETHSDHIINRIVRRVLENEDLSDKVRIYFIDNGEIDTIHIDKYEGINNAPENFFTQFGNETMAIMNACMNNFKKKGTEK